MPSMPDALILCGGAGVRLRSVTGGAPKAMAEVGGRPFLELLLRQLRRHGFERAILAIGYQGEAIRSRFSSRTCDLDLVYSAESSPLGTGGALRHAAGLVESDVVLIMNGDSYTPADLSKLVAEHRESKADATVVVVPADGRHDCGTVLLDGNGKVEGFEEKQHRFRPQYINAGIYLVSARILFDVPPDLPTSLEKDLLPRWLEEARNVGAFICDEECIDIGTPERYRNAQHVLGSAEDEETGRDARAIFA